MSCNFYLHNDPVGGTKYISGTTCSGTQAFYYLTIGQEVCMNSDLPLINLNNLQVGDTCFPVTPTPSTTPYEYCYFSAVTYYTAPYQCPNDGEIYEDIYGKMTFYATIGGIIVSSHPDLSFVITNGTDYETVTILDGQEFIEFVYPRVNFYYTETGCEEVILPDWTVYIPPVTNCLLFTPTPTVTPTVTPTITKTPTQTPSNTANPACPEQLEFYYSGVTSEYYPFAGTYQRAYAYTGGTMVGGYMSIDSITDVYTFIPGPDPSGKLSAIYTRVSGSTYYTIIPFAIDGGNMVSYTIYQTNTDYIFNGQQPLPFAVGLDGISISPNVGGVYYPRPGDNEPTNEELKLITYPVVCPTPTPTPSNTATQTPTPTTTATNTPTNTATPTITPTMTPNFVADCLYLSASTDASATYKSYVGFYYRVDTTPRYYKLSTRQTICANLPQTNLPYALFSGATGYIMVVDSNQSPGYAGSCLLTSGYTNLSTCNYIQPSNLGRTQITNLNWTLNQGIYVPAQGVFNIGSGLGDMQVFWCGFPIPEASPTPTPSVTATQTRTPPVTPSFTPTNTQTPTNTATNTQTPTPTKTPVYYQYDCEVWSDNGSSCSQTGSAQIKSITPLQIDYYYCINYDCSFPYLKYKPKVYQGVGNSPSYTAWGQPPGTNTDNDCTFVECCV